MKKRKQLVSIALCTLVVISCSSMTGLASSNKKDDDVSYYGRGDILFVGGSGEGNYSCIQDAIDNASDDDIVFVFDDSSPYFEHVIIDKSIQLIGENKKTTVINGNQTGDVVTVTSDQVTITGFTVMRSGRDFQDQNSGIKLLSNENTLTDVNITFNLFGILLQSSMGNTIVDNTINYNGYGIRFVDASSDNFILDNTLVSWSFDFNIYLKNFCNNNTISGNNITNYDAHGIYVFGCEDNSITNNSLVDCEVGISLVGSNYTVISDNFFQNEEDGLSLSWSTGNIISRNTFVNDGLFLYDSFDNSVTDNTVNGKPLIYLEDESDITISEDAGQILLVTCDTINIQNQDIGETNVAIELLGSENCVISDNTLRSNRRNIHLRDSDFNVIRDNIVRSEDWFIFMHTLELRNSNDNEIIRNEFVIDHDYSVVYFKESSRNRFSRNVILGVSDSVHFRLIIANSDDNTIYKNTIEAGDISLSNGMGNTILDNRIADGSLGIGGCWRNTITGNFISSNFDECGILLDGSVHNVINRNTIENCDGAFYITSSASNVIMKNNIIECGVQPAWFSNSPLNKWFRNYWGRALLRPMIIPGEIRIVRGWPYPDIVIPVVDIDLFPKQIPYVFGG